MTELDDKDVFEEPRFDYGNIEVHRFRTFEEAQRKMSLIDTIYFEGSITQRGPWWELRVEERV